MKECRCITCRWKRKNYMKGDCPPIELPSASMCKDGDCIYIEETKCGYCHRHCKCIGGILKRICMWKK